MIMLNSIKARVIAVSVGASSLMSSVSFAALSTEETAVYTSVTTLIADHSAAALALLTAIIGAFVGFKLLKKFVNKAT